MDSQPKQQIATLAIQLMAFARQLLALVSASGQGGQEGGQDGGQVVGEGGQGAAEGGQEDGQGTGEGGREDHGGENG
jgi:hypothetical protein